MQIACDSRPLRQAFIEPHREGMRHLTDTQSIEHPCSETNQRQNEQLEQVRLVPRCEQAEFDRGTFFVPYSVVIRCHHTKPVLAGTEIGVEGLTTSISVL